LSVNVIAELHPIRRTRVKITTSSKPVAEIINALNTGFSLSQARVCRNGEIVKDFSITAKDGDLLVIKFVPQGSNQQVGTGMKIGGWALAAVGGLLIATGLGAGIGAALIGAGVGMLAGGTALLNVNIPKMNDTEKPENDPSIRGARNQSRPHGRIPVLLGRHRLYPDLTANSFTSIIGNQQFLTQLFCGGYKDCVIDLSSFKLGDTPLINYSQTKDINEILAGADPIIRLEILQNGETSNLYSNCIHEDVINAPLQNEIEDGDGNKISGEIEKETPDNTDEINVDIFLYNGIGKYNDKGNLESASVEVRAWFKKDNEEYSLLGFFNDDSNVISGAELKTKRYQITKSGLTPGKYTVKIERVTSDSTDSKIVDQVYVGSIRSKKTRDKDGNIIRPIRAERQKDLTIIALRVMATGKLNNVLENFNYVATSKIPVYSGSGIGPLYWLNAAETRNPAALLLYALRGRAAQETVSPDDIDWQSFQDFYTWCENHNYTCNDYLSESVTIAEIMKMIGGCARADILRIDSKISVVQDIERPSHMGLFTPKNSISYSITMMKADIPDAIALRYIDEDSGYAQNEALIYNTPDGNRGGKEPEKIQKVVLWGITNSVQAQRIGMYNYACLKNRPFIHTIELDIEYLTCNKGDWIQYAGDIALTGSAQGRITGLIFNEDICIGIRVDEPVETEPGKQYAVRIRKSDGTVLIKDIAAVQRPNVIFFSEPFNKDNMPREGDVYAFGVRGYEVIDLIITDIQPQADLSATLTCVEYSPEIFKVDDPDFKLPEFENKITPVSGAVDSGVVGPARWRLFVTYHDGEEEAAKPQGDGQGDGWHYAQTLLSVWQSSKTAESVDSGEWGAPIRIKNFRSDTDVVPVWLTLSPQSKILDCDIYGKILTGLLPFTSQAALYKWNHQLPLVAGIQRFPGTGGDLFDPMLGDFVPTDKGINFSLENAPQGVSIDYKGVITVSKNAKLDGEHSIIVKAEYEGAVYEAVLFIQVKKSVGENVYLGTVERLTLNNQNVNIIKGNPVNGNLTAIQGNYVLAVAGGTAGVNIWKAGLVYQWSGLAWEERDINDYTDLYLSCYKDGLDVKELAGDTKWFGGLIAKMLIAQKAFIETLEAQLLKITGVIYGGDRFNEAGEEINKAANGWYLGPDGILKAAGGRFSGTVNAQGGHFENASAEELAITGGSIKVGPLFVSKQETNPSQPVTYFKSKLLTEFVNIYLPATPASGSITFTLVIYYGGKYGSADLYSIEFSKSWVSVSSGQTGANYINHSAVFNTSSGKKIVSAFQNDISTTIGQQVDIYGGGAGITFQLTGLPKVDPHEAGKLYCDYSGQLFISLG
jgi:hypothetical protein